MMSYSIISVNFEACKRLRYAMRFTFTHPLTAEGSFFSPDL